MDNNTHPSFHWSGNSYYYATGLSSIPHLCIRKWRVEEKVLSLKRSKGLRTMSNHLNKRIMNNIEMKELRDECFNMVKDFMPKDCFMGDVSGVFFFFDKPFVASINMKEKLMEPIRSQEDVRAVFYTYNRICPADCIIVIRDGKLKAFQMPLFSEDLHTNIKLALESLIKRKRIFPVPMKELCENIFSFPTSQASTRFVNSSMTRRAMFAEELAHIRTIR